MLHEKRSFLIGYSDRVGLVTALSVPDVATDGMLELMISSFSMKTFTCIPGFFRIQKSLESTTGIFEHELPNAGHRGNLHTKAVYIG